MFSALNTAVSALQQFQQDINVIGNNMANVNTTGYKDATMNFEDTLSQVIGLGGASTYQIGTGVATSSVGSGIGKQGLVNLYIFLAENDWILGFVMDLHV